MIAVFATFLVAVTMKNRIDQIERPIRTRLQKRGPTSSTISCKRRIKRKKKHYNRAVTFLSFFFFGGPGKVRARRHLSNRAESRLRRISLTNYTFHNDLPRSQVGTGRKHKYRRRKMNTSDWSYSTPFPKGICIFCKNQQIRWSLRRSNRGCKIRTELRKCCACKVRTCPAPNRTRLRARCNRTERTRIGRAADRRARNQRRTLRTTAPSNLANRCIFRCLSHEVQPEKFRNRFAFLRHANYHWIEKIIYNCIHFCSGGEEWVNLHSFDLISVEFGTDHESV